MKEIKPVIVILILTLMLKILILKVIRFNILLKENLNLIKTLVDRLKINALYILLIKIYLKENKL